jgi:hypothetical protein
VADFLVTVKANQQTLRRQIRSQFQGRRMSSDIEN